MSNLKLREVIKQIRQCKTAAEERAVISKESALIRNAFKVSRFKTRYPKEDKYWSKSGVSLKLISFALVSHYTIVPCRKKSVSIETAT
jgi:hypothetical protein